MSIKEFLGTQSRLSSQLRKSIRFDSERVLMVQAWCTSWVSETGLEPTDAPVYHCVLPLLYMCSWDLLGLLVYLNSVKNYVDSTQIWVLPKGNVLVHKLGHWDRIRTQWYKIRTAGCVPPIYVMCSYDLEGVLVYLNSVRNHVDSSTQIWVPPRKYLFSI